MHLGPLTVKIKDPQQQPPTENKYDVYRSIFPLWASFDRNTLSKFTNRNPLIWCQNQQNIEATKLDREWRKNHCVREKWWLVGGWTNPFEKYARQIGSFSGIGGENKKYLKPPSRERRLIMEGVSLIAQSLKIRRKSPQPVLKIRLSKQLFTHFYHYHHY